MTMTYGIYPKAITVSIQCWVDWLQSLKQFFINVSYNILVASLTLMALFQEVSGSGASLRVGPPSAQQRNADEVSQ